MQKLILIGHLGQDATVIKSENQKSDFMKFTVANTERYKNSTGEQTERTFWYNVIFKYSENLAKYLKKGTQVYLEGSLTPNLYDTKEGGKGLSLDLRATKIELLSPAK
jgi:single-strand DNA-binding protein